MNDDELKTISFDEDGQPLAKNPGADEQPPAPAAGEEARHKTSLKEKVAELGLEIEVLKSELDNAKAEADTYISLAQRQKAEFENYKKRTLEQSAAVRQDGLCEGVLKILPVYDVITKALNMIKDENTLKGLNMIMQTLIESFKSLGIETIDSLGSDFDPAFHNAVMNEEAETEDGKGKITEVFQEGFKMGDKVLRYAMVKVSI